MMSQITSCDSACENVGNNSPHLQVYLNMDFEGHYIIDDSCTSVLFWQAVSDKGFILLISVEKGSIEWQK